MSCTQAGVSRTAFTPDGLIVGDDIETTEVFITPGVDYKRGDLLAHDAATNTVNTTADPAQAVFIMVHDLSAAQATAHAATGYQLQVYCDGEFSQSAVTLKGVALTNVQVPVAKGALARHSIELRRVI